MSRKMLYDLWDLRELRSNGIRWREYRSPLRSRWSFDRPLCASKFRQRLRIAWLVFNYDVDVFVWCHEDWQRLKDRDQWGRLYDIYSLKNLKALGYGPEEPDLQGSWRPARPFPFYSFPNRFWLAWLVISGKADAFVWRTEDWDGIQAGAK